MPRRYFPSSLLYGFGLALVLSLSFNGFLLYKQSHQRTGYEYSVERSAHALENVAWQQQLSNCHQANEQKDSLIRRLAQPLNAPPGQADIARHNQQTTSSYNHNIP